MNRSTLIVRRLHRGSSFVNSASPSCRASAQPQPTNTRLSIVTNIYKKSMSILITRSASQDEKISKSQSSSSPSAVTKNLPPWVLAWKFKFDKDARAPVHWFADKANQWIYLDWLGQTLGYKSREDWHFPSFPTFLIPLSITPFLTIGLLVNYYGSSPIKLISSVFTDFEFLPWLFTACPRSFFKSRENRIKYVDWLLAKVGVKSYAELTKEHFLQNGGGGLLVLFGGSPLRVVNSLNTESQGESALKNLKRKPRGFWESRENQKKVIDDIGKEIGVTGSDLSAWYNISVADLKKMGAGPLIVAYSDSIFDMLKSLYPDYNWLPWKFKKTPQRLSSDHEFLRSYIPEIEKELKISNPEDWYRVSDTELASLGVLHVVKKFGTLFDFLGKFRPEYKYDKDKFSKN